MVSSCYEIETGKNMINEKDLALDAIRKKLTGKSLSYKEVFAVMDEISHNRLGDVLTTYFAASGYSHGFSNEELFFLTKAMVETGEKLHFSGIVADKHSIGGVPGTRTTLIVVPLVAAAGFTIPKSSSRAITTPDGTADDMEILSRVEFSKEEIYKIVKQTNACIVWGGSFNIAPADDIMIHVERPLLLESYDKIVVSIMAKKIAFGSNHVIIDMPYGTTVKVHRKEDAETLKRKFFSVAERFGMHIAVHTHEVVQPAGRGIGPVLETRESFRVLEQTEDRPIDLEKHALDLASMLLALCIHTHDEKQEHRIKKEYGSIRGWATFLLQSGKALEKMKEIIHAQQGDPTVTSAALTRKLGGYRAEMQSYKRSTVTSINSKNLTVIAKILGAPHQKGSGVYLQKKVGETAEKGDALLTLFSENAYNLREAKESLKNFAILEFE